MKLDNSLSAIVTGGASGLGGATVKALRAHGVKVAIFDMNEAAGTAFAANHQVNGEVVKVDKSAGKITVKHGPIKNLDMDSMTMVFRVADPAMLDKVKAGDKVKFKAVNEAGKFTVTELKVVR